MEMGNHFRRLLRVDFLPLGYHLRIQFPLPESSPRVLDDIGERMGRGAIQVGDDLLRLLEDRQQLLLDHERQRMGSNADPLGHDLLCVLPLAKPRRGILHHERQLLGVHAIPLGDHLNRVLGFASIPMGDDFDRVLGIDPDPLGHQFLRLLAIPTQLLLDHVGRRVGHHQMALEHEFIGLRRQHAHQFLLHHRQNDARESLDAAADVRGRIYRPGFLHRDRPHDARRRSHTAGHHRFSFVHKFYRRRDRHHYARRELRRHRLHYPRRHPEGQRPRVHPIRYRRHRLPRWLRPLRQLREVGTEQHARRRALSVRFRRRLGWRHMGHDHAIRIRPAHQSSALYDRYRHDRRHRHELDDIRLLRSQYADRLHQRLSRHRHHLAVHKLSVAGDVLASRYAATSSLASIFPYASSTAFTATSLFSTTASTTNLTVSGFATSTFNGGINLATGCFSLNGTCITSGSAADGTFSTTSADHWDSTKGRWATSSANYWESTQTRWATSSSDYWLAQKTTDNIAEGSNLYFNSNRVASVIAATTTDALPQGTTNKYYSTNLFAGSLAGTTTDALREGSTNFYFTNNRVASVIAGTTTTALAEGANKYYTDQRADTRINATSSIGTLTSAPNLGTLATTLSGFLKATAGVLSTALINLASDITGVLPVGNGGTGWSNIAASAIPYGNGSSALATTSAGTAGYVLAYLGGVPTWTATTTFSAPLSYSGGAVSIAAANGGADGYLSSTDWNAFNTKFATTSSDYWLSQYSKGFFFSTTSADAWDATRWRWSTSSSDFAVNAFISSSTTIPKTFAANSWTALQTFANGFISNASSTFTTGLFSMNGGASTTNFSASGNVVLGNATTTALFATTASTTNLFGAGLSLCQGGNVLTWASGRFGCAADQWGAAGSAWPFTPSSNYGVAVQSTSTPVWATAGLMASSTSYFVNASSTALTVSGTAFFGTATSTTDQDVSRLHGQ